MWFLGDIHGDLHILEDARRKTTGPLIQVGDFGFSPRTLAWLRGQSFDHPTYLMEGNHEVHALVPFESPGFHNIAPNCWIVGRGTVADIDGIRVGFMGGACSIDKAARLSHGAHWSADEVVTDEQVDALIASVIASGPVELLVTHTPPESLIVRHFDRMDKVRYFGVSPDWVGAGSSLRVDRLWDALGRPPLVCGHMHRTVAGDGYRMLDINELYQFDPAAARGGSGGPNRPVEV